MMVRGIVVALLCLLAMPSAAQYNIRKMMEEGRRTLDQGYYVTSLQLFSRIVALKPNLYEAWYLMALAKYHLEDYKGSGGDCRRALALQPYIAEIYDLYGMVSIREGHYDTGITGLTVLTAFIRPVTGRPLSASWIIFSAAGVPSIRRLCCVQTSSPAAGPGRSLSVRADRRCRHCRDCGRKGTADPS